MLIEFEAKARDAMAGYGLMPPQIVFDGKIHKFDDNPKHKSKAQWYVLHADSMSAWGAFGDYRRGIFQSFSTKSQKEMSQTEKLQYKKKQEAIKRQYEKDKRESAKRAVEKSAKMLDTVELKPHQYTTKKQVKQYAGTGVYRGAFVIPLYADKELKGAQIIAGDGVKRFVTGTQKKGAYFPIGDFKEPSVILIAEGYATAASLHEATGKPCVVAFDAYNLLDVGRSVRKAFPAANIIFCADNDESETGITKANEAATACKGVVRLCPIISDFNDLHVQQGLDAVCENIFPKHILTHEQENNEITDLEYQKNWWDSWVYINHEDKFYSLDKHMRYSQTAFNLENGHLIPANDKGQKKTAASMVTNDSLIKVIAKAVYAPNVQEIIFKDNNLECLNTFNKETLPKPADKYTNEGMTAIQRITDHIFYICNQNMEHTQLMLNWIAWQLQHKGEKILWCPVIQGVEGTGKSFFGELLEHLLGHENINTVAPREVLSSFNGWATNACVSVLSEIRIVGQDRYEAVNALKPLITDQVVQINIKNVPAYNVRNVTNYICMTNFKDAIPVTATDRRWWILYSDYATLDDFLAACGGDEPDKYFLRLFDGLRQHSAEVVKYFYEYKISDDFKNIKQAPKTIYKEALLRNEQEKSMPIHDAVELLNNGGDYFNNEILSSSDFFIKLSETSDDLHLQTSQRASFLLKLGFTFHKIMKIDGKSRKIWCRKINLDDDFIREEMRKTLYR